MVWETRLQAGSDCFLLFSQRGLLCELLVEARELLAWAVVYVNFPFKDTLDQSRINADVELIPKIYIHISECFELIMRSYCEKTAKKLYSMWTSPLKATETSLELMLMMSLFQIYILYLSLGVLSYFRRITVKKWQKNEFYVNCPLKATEPV